MSLLLRKISQEECETQRKSELGGDLSEDLDLAEQLRRETRAWGARARHLVLASVSARVGAEARALCEATLERLLKVGDLLEGPGALLSPGPLRIVELPRGGWVLLGAVGNQEVASELGEGALVQGIPRRVLPATSSAKVQGVCEHHQGALLSLEDASGLSGVLDAGAHLTRLDTRRQDANLEELVGVTSWSDVQAFSSTGAWKHLGTAPQSRLLRGRSSGYSVFGWSPSPEGKVLRISADEARRAAFGLCLEQGVPVQASVARQDEHNVLVTFPLPLPRAEYRALAMLRNGTISGGKASLLDGEDWSWLQLHLNRTLGVVEGISS